MRFGAPILFLFLSLAYSLADSKNAGNLKLENENPATTVGTSVWPNEGAPNLFRPVVNDKSGVYIGVGSFRTLSMLGMGNYSNGILIDIDEGTANFNLANLQLIRQCASRREYLSALFGVNISPDLLHSIDSMRDLTELKAFRGSKEADPLFFLKNLSPSEKDLITSRASPSQLQQMRKWVFRTEEQWEATIFGSDAIFDRVKALGENDKISVVVGNLATRGKALQSIDRELRRRKLEISTVDLSNLLDNKNEKQVRAILKNLQRLPLSADSTLLLTSLDFPFANEVLGKKGGWSYSFAEFRKLGLQNRSLKEVVMALTDICTRICRRIAIP